ncbi:hypothetical protein Bca52824_001226 [Brassica carinata]|uniref:Uncharacterized protein n=1 Tax=Brassica carinata TaxID=52824 RepID=A0A8X7WGY6_BRACI|nr:hypothetical protein Bca52824_001226 [Brassica carinata]
MGSDQSTLPAFEKGTAIRTGAPEGRPLVSKLLGRTTGVSCRNSEQNHNTEDLIESDDSVTEGKVGDDLAAREIGRDGAVASDRTLARHTVDRSVGSMRKIHRLTPFAYLPHPNTIGAEDTFLEDLPKVVVLSQQTWGSFDRKRISRQLTCIAKVDWAQDVPCVTTAGKRMKLPLMGNIPKAYLRYSDILRAQLGGGSFSSMSVSEGKDSELAEEAAASEKDIGVTDLLDKKTGVSITDASTKGPTEPASSASPSKKKKNKSSRKAMVDSDDERDLAEKDQAEGDRSTTEENGHNNPTEGDPVGSFDGKRKGPTGGGSPGPGGGKRMRLFDRSPLSFKEIALPAFSFAAMGRIDPSIRQICIRGSTHLVPESPELVFPDAFNRSAEADMELILDYEQALRRMASDLSKAEAALEIKDAEIEKSKRDALDNSKEMIAERTCYYRERTQATEKAACLKEELRTAQSEIARLEAGRVEEAEKSKKTLDRVRQIHRRKLTSEKSCILAEATDHFDKSRRYMADRDEREEKLLLHIQAFGTLEAMDMLEEWGMHVPKKLKDILTAKEAKYKEEVNGVVVEDITEQNLTASSLPPYSGNSY